MRTLSIVAILGIVLVASALDLALGMLWVIALCGVLLLRRRMRLAAWLVLVASIGFFVVAARSGWLTPPTPGSYAAGWIPTWGESSSAAPPGWLIAEAPLREARATLAARAREELRLTGSELEQRAGAVIELARRLGPLRRDAPQETLAVEAVARRLARTLAAPEFRDLEARRAAAAAHLAELDRRLRGARDASEVAGILRGSDPAAMAHASLRPVREDLAAASAAVASLMRVLGGGVPVATTAATVGYDGGRNALRWEVRHTVTGAPGVRLLRMETRAFRGVGRPGAPLSLTYVAGEEPARPVASGAWLELEPAPRSVVVSAAWSEAPTGTPIRAPLRWPTFEGMALRIATEEDDVVITTVLDGRPEIELPLTVRLPAPRLARVTVPRYSLYFTDRPGTLTAGSEGDSWEPTGERPSSARIELVPDRLVLRNGAFARIHRYLYRPNLATAAVAIGLAALTLVLARRPRPNAEGG